MTQTYVGLSYLNSVQEPHKYPFMGLRFPNGRLTTVFQIQRENESLDIHISKVHSLECHGHGSSCRAKDFGHRTSRAFMHILHQMDFNIGTSRS